MEFDQARRQQRQSKTRLELGDAANCSLKTHTVSKEIVEDQSYGFP